jgi:uncharacterized membrane protein YeaQ/YmgE (transglycosylase-associated protein family)
MRLSDARQKDKVTAMSTWLMRWILVGLVAGVAARLVLPKREAGGFVATILVGIAGALLGGYLGRAFGNFGPSHPMGWAAAIVGAVVLLAIYRVIMASRKS